MRHFKGERHIYRCVTGLTDKLSPVLFVSVHILDSESNFRNMKPRGFINPYQHNIRIRQEMGQDVRMWWYLIIMNWERARQAAVVSWGCE